MGASSGDETPFGRYRLIELLGRGGMGEVWRAHDTRTDRIVAIKVLPAHYSDDPKFQRRFLREAHAAARLDNPHVVPIHDYGEIDGRLYVDMRLVRGHDLHTVLASGPIEPRRAVRIIEQVAKALNAAHRVGLVHRDVKPSNILLDEDDFAYLIDFGIARAADDTRMTGTGNAIGTFHYMAPERMGGHPDDARADIYALACVLYECLTGRPPFAGTNMASLIAAHINSPPPRPSDTKPVVPQQLDAVIATGMAKSPDQRYATTIEFANAARDAFTVPIQRPAPAPVADTTPAPLVDATPRSAVPIPHDQWQPPPPSASADAAEYGRLTPRRRRLLSLSAISKVALIVLILCFGGASGYIVWQHRDGAERAQRAANFVAGARQGVVNMLSLDFRRAKEDVQRVIDSSTGQFRDDFAKRATDFTKVVEQSNVVSQGTIKSAALESMNEHSALVLVSATSKTTNAAGAQDEPRAFRLRVTVTEDGGQYKMSKVDFVQ